MSAITITFGARGEAAAVREAQLVAEGLAKQSGRAPGGSDVQTVEGAVLGVRASIPIAQYGRGTDTRESQRRASHRETAQGTVSLVLSGFVDNGPEVLAAAGLDAEASVADALLELYLEHGASFIEQVGGAFAIALWDGRNQRGHLLRDRLGIEPLYFAVVGREGLLRASSEPKGLLVDQRIPRRFDLQAIPDLLIVENTRDDRISRPVGGPPRRDSHFPSWPHQSAGVLATAEDTEVADRTRSSRGCRRTTRSVCSTTRTA